MLAFSSQEFYDIFDIVLSLHLPNNVSFIHTFALCHPYLLCHPVLCWNSTPVIESSQSNTLCIGIFLVSLFALMGGGGGPMVATSVKISGVVGCVDISTLQHQARFLHCIFFMNHFISCFILSCVGGGGGKGTLCVFFSNFFVCVFAFFDFDFKFLFEMVSFK